MTTKSMSMDPREARFLASQAERLSGKKKGGGSNNEYAPGLADEEGVGVGVGVDSNGNDAGSISISIGNKEQSHLFWKNFRSLCSEFQSKIASLLLITITSSSSSDAVDNDNNDDKRISKNENAKAYYATASRRNEGRIKLDSILREVRSLQRHALSSSSSVLSSSPTIGSNNNQNNDNENNNSNNGGSENNEPLQSILMSILQSPMPDVTQTDMRLISQEIDGILKNIDLAREIICPKEKFVFKRYRKAMEERERLGLGLGGDNVNCSTTAVTESADIVDTERNNVGEEKTTEQQDKLLRSNYGGVLENKSNCTIEISSDGIVLIDETTEETLQYYNAPRRIHALHPTTTPTPSTNDRKQQPTQTAQISTAIENEEAASPLPSSSFLLQNLRNVTLILHGSRPSLHMKHIYNCTIYVSEPTLGPVHVTDCTDSEIWCSCYQLRIHDSKCIKFSVWVRSGPIIEDCNGMVFEGKYYSEETKNDIVGGNSLVSDGVVGRNMFWDVKDFNWLRALRKSPNFTVITKSTTAESEKEGSVAEVSVDAGTIETAAPAVLMEEEDSDDEL